MNLTTYQPPKAERRTDAPFTFPNQRPLPVADRPRVASLRCAGTFSKWLGQRRFTRLVGVPRCALQARPQEPGPARAILTTTRPLTNEQRLDAWQELQASGDTGPSDSRCHSRSVIGRVFYFAANLTGLAAWFGAIFAVTYIIGALMEPVEPETRCFTTATADTDYCREQFAWEGKP